MRLRAADGSYPPHPHPQVRVAVGEWAAEVDEAIAPLIRELWRAGWETQGSCECCTLPGATDKVWVEFVHPYPLGGFIDAVSTPRNPSIGLRLRWAWWWFIQACTLDRIERYFVPPSFTDPRALWEYHVRVDDVDTGTRKPLVIYTTAFAVLFSGAELPSVVAAMRAYNDRAGKEPSRR